MFDLILAKFEEDLKKDYKDYNFYITDEMEDKDFVRNTVVCEISEITVSDSKYYSVMLNFYITKPKIQDDLGKFIVQCIDIQKKISNLERNKSFFAKKLTIEFGELKSNDVKDTFRVCRIAGSFDITLPVENIILEKEKYEPMMRLFIDKNEVR